MESLSLAVTRRAIQLVTIFGLGLSNAACERGLASSSSSSGAPSTAPSTRSPKADDGAGLPPPLPFVAAPNGYGLRRPDPVIVSNAGPKRDQCEQLKRALTVHAERLRVAQEAEDKRTDMGAAPLRRRQVVKFS